MKKIFSILIVSILISCSSTSGTISSSSRSSISPMALTLIDVIVGKFPGVKVIGSNVANSTPKIIIRGGSMSMNNQAYAVYDVDGILYTDCPTFIDPQQIKSVTILRSLAATNRYGGVARGGAIVIRLKANN
ncbi:MAG TPA: TonB-dependent receptor plug domain-containing protein [Flavobacteriaceae bacterium]|nr:TonB-dependent receptor plug domain-containing protein [Flavobacteriaceae bacterium]